MVNIAINLGVEDGVVKNMDIIKCGYERCEYCVNDVDKPMSIQEVLAEIKQYISELK